MTGLATLVWQARLWKDTRGQDFLEYALMAGFVASVAVFIVPGFDSQVSAVFAKVLIQLHRFGG